ncbi:phosphoglucomutase, alpha-D-glucose phosphate-specific, partial [bacterium]|nr:phosphoglucomutase, alpha-D-glucose phosphate-specific [bacterium]
MTHPLAGRPAPADQLCDIAALLAAYRRRPDIAQPGQRVAFGTSGHRGSALDGAFNEAHIHAIVQAICEQRAAAGINGPLFVGMDSHALSAPAQQSAIEVLAANGVVTHLQANGGLTPTPAISNAILAHNANAAAPRADGVVITPSHNPPR